ncbi:aspartate-alanine antiporter [Achromobacter spanius]|uniref:Aspartate-alanine antiporter n=1 Tax=Achromobacter spanius TaxID=217203 RepID=A0A2S5GLY4_9BURK|nr:aspartate-alanine antiporter [Achromobacter spanius]PPA74082.1 aspartate-alanine antiporter [Achromobacter spanius]
MDFLGNLLQRYPELAVFLAIGLGYWVGGFKIRGVGFGPVTGSLLAGLLIGYFFLIPVSDTAKQVLFLLFMFGIGYSVGPSFFRGMKDGGWRWAVLGVVIPVAGLLTAWALALLLKLELGYAVGLISGGLTESPAIGTGSEAIRNLPIGAAEKDRLISQIAVADALCYIFGTFGIIWFCSSLGPKLLRVDLKAEGARLEQAYGIQRQKAGVASAWRKFDLRAYLLQPDHPAVGHSVALVESRYAPDRMFVERIRRDGSLLAVEPTTVLRAGDVVAVSGKSEVILKWLDGHAVEQADRELLDIPSAMYDVVLSNPALVGKTVAQIAEQAQEVRGVFLRDIRRNGVQIPVGSKTVLLRGDVLSIVGLEPAVERVAERMGSIVRELNATDFVALGFGIFVGAVVGTSLVLPIGSMHIAIGSSVGTLILGLLVGWRNSARPLFGRISHGALEFMKSIGLAGFVAMIGLKAGPVFVQALQEVGLTIFLAGIVVTMVPQFVGLLFGRYVLKLEPLLLLGALAGAQTMTAGLAAVQEKSQSPVAVIGYSGTVAFGHILITTWGTVIVWLLY